MKIKNKKTIFICQVSAGVLKIAKCIAGGNSGMKVSDLAIEALSSGRDDKELTEKSRRAFKKLGYNRNPIIVSLPRIQATCRQLRLPSQSPQEIENIIRLRAGTYLPYPAEELVTAYEVISVDSQGYSDLNLAIVQNEAVTRLVNIFGSFKPAAFSIVLSSYGLSRLYAYLKPQAKSAVILIDIDSGHAELVITANKKLLFSRYFNLDRAKPDWQDLFIDEFNKSRDVYRKEMPGEMPDKVIILGEGRSVEEAAELLKKKAGLTAEILPYYKALMSGYSPDKIPTAEHSFAGIAGLGAADIEGSLYLLPRGIKEKARRIAQGRQRRGMILLFSAIIAIWSLAGVKNLENKAAYLALLQAELNKIADDARPLEAMDKRMRLLRDRSTEESLNLAIIPELHSIMPGQIYLTNLACEDEKNVTLRGQAKELNGILEFGSRLGGSPLFRNFTVKIKYATKRKASQGEIIDFEINCFKL